MWSLNIPMVFGRKKSPPKLSDFQTGRFFPPPTKSGLDQKVGSLGYRLGKYTHLIERLGGLVRYFGQIITTKSPVGHPKWSWLSGNPLQNALTIQF